MNKILIAIVIIFLLAGGIYFGAKQVKKSQQAQMQGQNALQQAQTQQQVITQVPSQTSMFNEDDPTVMVQDQADEQTLTQVSLDDTTDDSVLADTSGL